MSHEITNTIKVPEQPQPPKRAVLAFSFLQKFNAQKIRDIGSCQGVTAIASLPPKVSQQSEITFDKMINIIRANREYTAIGTLITEISQGEYCYTPDQLVLDNDSNGNYVLLSAITKPEELMIKAGFLPVETDLSTLKVSAIVADIQYDRGNGHVLTLLPDSIAWKGLEPPVWYSGLPKDYGWPSHKLIDCRTNFYHYRDNPIVDVSTAPRINSYLHELRFLRKGGKCHVTLHFVYTVNPQQ